jgi:transcriptional regulator GlxA family with amidase domain
MNIKLLTEQNWLALAQQANWSVTKLAALCSVSVRTLERNFQQIYGKPPKSWLIEQRIRNATEFLRDGSSVKETAAIMGYRHASTFTREFKKSFGHTGQCPHDLANPCPEKRNGIT